MRRTTTASLSLHENRNLTVPWFFPTPPSCFLSALFSQSRSVISLLSTGSARSLVRVRRAIFNGVVNELDPRSKRESSRTAVVEKLSVASDPSAGEVVDGEVFCEEVADVEDGKGCMDEEVDPSSTSANRSRIECVMSGEGG